MLVDNIKRRYSNPLDRVSLQGWLYSRLGNNIIQGGGESGLVGDEAIFTAVYSFLARERYRVERTNRFRQKRQEAKLKYLKLAKNKNRQDAARKRVRDPNGKFQGGPLFRRPKILFLIHKVVKRLQQ